MCLPDFIEFKKISKNEPLIGYRNWVLDIKTSELKSIDQNYIWSGKTEGPHKILDRDSGIYAYNNNNNYYNYNNNYYYYYNYYYNYDNNNNYDNYYYNYYYNNYYHLSGIIQQYGKVAIHREGQRSQYAKIQKFFTIRETDAVGPKKFLNWIPIFNKQIEELAKKFNTETIYWQDFKEERENKK